MYDIAFEKELLFEQMKKGCSDCGFRMKCEDMTNSEVDNCFHCFVEKERVFPLLKKFNMDINEWTCYGKMSINSLIRLYLYLKSEES